MMNIEALTNMVYTLAHKEGLRTCEVREYLEQYNLGEASADCGATKRCLLFKDFPYVLKWSASSCYARVEVEYYKRAVQTGIAQFFPKTYLLCSVKGIDYIIQEKVLSSLQDIYEHKELRSKLENSAYGNDVKDNARMFRRNLNCRISDTWSMYVAQMHDKEIMMKLCRFINDNNINDLHNGNVGFDIKENPIILDFSGYNRLDRLTGVSFRVFSSEYPSCSYSSSSSDSSLYEYSSSSTPSWWS